MEGGLTVAGDLNCIAPIPVGRKGHSPFKLRGNAIVGLLRSTAQEKRSASGDRSQHVW